MIRRDRESALRFLAAAGVYLPPWAPAFGQWIVQDHRSKLAAGAIVLGGLTLGRWLHAKSRAATIALAVPYYAALLALNLFFGYMGRWMDPTYFAIVVALAALSLVPRARRVLVPVQLVLTVLVLFGYAARDLWAHAPGFALACIPGAALGLACVAWIVHRGRAAEFSGLAWALAVFGLLLYPRGAIVYGLDFPGYLPRVLAQPGVTALFDTRDPGLRAALGTQTMFVARVPGTETYVVGPQKPFTHLGLYAPGPPPRVTRLDVKTRGADNLVFDPEDPRTVFVGTVDRLLEVSTRPPLIRRELPLKQSIHNLNFLQYDSGADRLFVSQDFGREVFVVDRRTLREVARIPCAPRAVTDDVWVDPVGRQVMVSGTYAVGWRVDTYDLATLARRRTHLWPWDIGFHFSTIDPEGRRAYLGSTTSGRVRVLDLDTLDPVGEFRLEVGLRNLNFDARRGWVLVGSYFRGNLFVVDARDSRVIGRLFLGPRLRWVEVDRERGTWTATTSVGGFAIDPDAAFPAEKVVAGDRR
jgi:hypothetical protein